MFNLKTERWNGSSLAMDALPDPNPAHPRLPAGSATPQTFTNVTTSDLLVGASARAGGASVWAVGYSGTSGSLNPLAPQASG